MNRLNLREIVSNGALVVCSLLLTFALVEIVYSSIGLSIYRKGKVTGPRWQWQWLVFDPIEGWVNRPKYKHDENFEIDVNGFRIVSGMANSAVRTVVCMGDSGTFGIWNDGEWIRFPSYPPKLQELLGIDWRVLNAGVVGYTSSHLLRQYMTRIRKLKNKPTYILIRTGFNDHKLEWDSRRAVREPVSPLKRTLLYNFGSTFTIQTAIALNNRNPVAGTPGRRWHSLEEFKTNLEKLITYARADGVTPVLVDYPIRPASFPGLIPAGELPPDLGVADYADLIRLHAEYNGAIVAVGRDTGTPVIETTHLLTDIRSQGFSSTDVAHPNARGMAIVAQQIASFLRSTP
ncbi:MAG: SGNH/GDSL hydrolase family protein [Leptospirales bacterium]|nr:SGNH/GDSL hydrolase family protein [Leptospirales bacterium]